MPRIPKKPGKPIPKGMRPKPQRLKLAIAKGLNAFDQLPEGVLTLPEQTVLRRIKDIHNGSIRGTLSGADLRNMRVIAARHRIKL